MTEIRAARAGDLPELDALFRGAFGHGLSVEEWEWKYRRLPGEARSVVAVAADGEVLAHAGALRLPAWSAADGEGGLWQLADFAGAARGGGLVPPLVRAGRALLEGIPAAGDLPWIFGFPSPRHFRLGERTFGYRPLVEIRPLAGPIPDTSPPAVAPAHAEACERLDPADELAERAWRACIEGWGTSGGVRRTAAFLNWRYHDRPGRYYRYYRLAAGDPRSGRRGLERVEDRAVLAAENERMNGSTAARSTPRTPPAPAGSTLGAGASEGLAVFAFVGPEAWAAELWLPPAGDWYDALSAVAADLRAAGLVTWRFWPPPPRSGLDATLAALGLRPLDETVFAGCRGAPGGPDPAAAAAGFHYAMGDYDAV